MIKIKRYFKERKIVLQKSSRDRSEKRRNIWIKIDVRV